MIDAAINLCVGEDGTATLADIAMGAAWGDPHAAQLGSLHEFIYEMGDNYELLGADDDGFPIAVRRWDVPPPAAVRQGEGMGKGRHQLIDATTHRRRVGQEVEMEEG